MSTKNYDETFIPTYSEQVYPKGLVLESTYFHNSNNMPVSIDMRKAPKAFLAVDPWEQQIIEIVRACFHLGLSRWSCGTLVMVVGLV